MKNYLIHFIFVAFLTKATFFMGTGVCEQDFMHGSRSDYCPQPVGAIGFDLTVVEQGRHSITAEAVHYSEIEFENEDRGTEFYLLKYNFELFNKEQ